MLKRKGKVFELFVCLAVGLVIGGIFGLLRLPLPVPHGLGGVLGLIGMFIGSQIVRILV
jgi:XapX domain-containing protein